MPRRFLAVLAGTLLAGTACRGNGNGYSAAEAAELSVRAQRLTQKLAAASADSALGEPLARWILPPTMAEVSGLALLDSTRLLAHNDETARIAVVDFRRGVVLNQFSVGETGMRGDFEGIAVAGDRIFLVASNGTLYEFAPGEEGERVRYAEHDTRLGKECEFEGVAHDSATASLLLACKRVLKGDESRLVIYRWDIGRRALVPEPVISIPVEEVIGANPWDALRPSDITVDPATGHYVLVAAQQRALIELTPGGEVVQTRPLPDAHPQAEGVAVTGDGILLVSDEASNSAGTITLYRWPARTSTRGTP
ncbi:MAG TPA: SdiA-regulated domain-containing protein [Gemmatimonadaceae bacterium]|nr:SdiA-regulated domain-containing protein [Gemmatimonadaceae bacterium]